MHAPFSNQREGVGYILLLSPLDHRLPRCLELFMSPPLIALFHHSTRNTHSLILEYPSMGKHVSPSYLRRVFAFIFKTFFYYCCYCCYFSGG